MAKAKPREEPEMPEVPSSINFRVSPALGRRISATAKRLGLDLSNFVRHVLTKHLPEYERQAEQLPEESP